jgi:MFS family permease
VGHAPAPLVCVATSANRHPLTLTDIAGVGALPGGVSCVQSSGAANMPHPSSPSARDTTAAPPTSLWRNRDFVVLWSGQTVSALGSRISDIGLALVVLAVSHSAAQVAFIASVEALPFLLLTLPAGVLMDRWDRKWVMLASDIGRAVCLASIAGALAIGRLTMAQLYVVALVEGSFATLYNLAALAGMHRIVPPSQLGKASSASYISGNSASLVGPPIGSVLFAASRAAPFIADALSYIGSVASLLWVRSALQERRDAAQSDSGGALFATLAAGFRWMWRQPVLRFQAVAGCVVSFALYPMTPLAIALAVHLRAPQASIGLIFTLGAVGGLAGGVVGQWMQRRLRFGPLMSLHFALLGAIFLGFIFAGSIVWLGVCLAAISLVEAVGSIANIAYRLAHTPDAYQGRVNSIHRFVGFGVGRPLGAAALGLLLARVGLHPSIVIFAGVLAAFALATILYTPVRTLSPLD